MKVLSILEGASRSPNDLTILQSNRRSDIEINFAIAGVFLTHSEPSPKLMTWLNNMAIDAFSVNYLEDGGRATITVSTRIDAYSIRETFPSEFDACVILSKKLVMSSWPISSAVAEFERRSRRR
ncbi:hypothetical protein [Azospirillum doebereinerae]